MRRPNGLTTSKIDRDRRIDIHPILRFSLQTEINGDLGVYSGPKEDTPSFSQFTF